MKLAFSEAVCHHKATAAHKNFFLLNITPRGVQLNSCFPIHFWNEPTGRYKGRKPLFFVQKITEPFLRTLTLPFGIREYQKYHNQGIYTMFQGYPKKFLFLLLTFGVWIHSEFSHCGFCMRCSLFL